MSDTPANRTPQEVEERFRQVLAEGDVEQPDEVEYDSAANELIFLWHGPKVAIVVELDADGPVGVYPRTPMRPPI